VGSDARELAVFTYDVMVSPPPTILGLEVWQHIPDMRRSLFHTTSKRVGLERLETRVFHDMRLASRTISWAEVRTCLKEITFSNVGWDLKDLKYLRARLQERLASWHSAVHYVAGQMVYNVNVLF
jgi:hypothetical protein